MSVYKKYSLPGGRGAQSLEIESIQELAARLAQLEAGEKLIIKCEHGKLSLVVLSGLMMKPGCFAVGEPKHLAELLHRTLPESDKFPRRDELEDFGRELPRRVVMEADEIKGLPKVEIEEVSLSEARRLMAERVKGHGNKEDVYGVGGDVRQGDVGGDSGGGTGVQDGAVGPEDSD